MAGRSSSGDLFWLWALAGARRLGDIICRRRRSAIPAVLRSGRYGVGLGDGGGEGGAPGVLQLQG